MAMHCLLASTIRMKKLDPRSSLLIGGEWRPASNGARYDVVNPATEEIIGYAPQAGAADALDAVEAADRGLQKWRRTDPWTRSKVIRRISRLIDERRKEIARLITVEMGKPLDQAEGEVQATIDLYDWFADETRRVYGQVIEARKPANRQYVTFEPVGIVAAFTAWNFPVLLMSRKIAPALAAGCSIVCRPAEEAPGAVLAIAACCMDAGVPAGVVNVLTGVPGEITSTLMAAPSVRKVTFTGSILVGKMLMRQAADTVKRLTMELGGHAPVIVHSDVDVDRVAQMSAVSKYRNGGQVCAAPTRFYVHESKADDFARVFAERAGRLKVGDGLESSVEVGPMATRKRRDAVEGLVEDAMSKNAKLISGGRRPAHLNRGWFFEPTVLLDPADDSRMMTEEPFGPVATINRFSTMDEVIAKANGLEFGLAAYVFTNSLTKAHETADALEAGVVGVNTFVASLAETPFGGTKQSGFGREGGFLGIRDYLDAKFTNMEFLD